jgi:hypothetical protein
METEKKIEFYKKRSVGEVLSAVAEFLLQNWKVMYKNILIVGGPLACLLGIFQHNYTTAVTAAVISSDFSPTFLFNALIFLTISVLLNIFLYSITATFLSRYGDGKLTKDTKWNDLKESVYLYAGKTFLLFLCLLCVIFIVALAFSFLIGIIVAGTGGFSQVVVGIIVLIVLGLLIPFLPGLSLVFFPAYFHNEATVSSFTKGISLGFRHWGSTFLVLLISVIITAVITYLFSGAYQLWTLFGAMLQLGPVGVIISYLFSILSAFANVFAAPVMITFLAFQYFNIIEEEEGISVQSGIDEFDNL